jgi:hypothetical protein
MLDMINVGLRTLMFIGFILFVIRPALMSMFSRASDRVGIEQAAEFAVMSAFKNQFDKVLNAPIPTTLSLEDMREPTEPDPVPVAVEPIVLPPKPNPFIRQYRENSIKEKRLAAQRLEAEAAQNALTDEQDDEVGEMDAIKQRMKDHKHKSKPSIPTELLSGANSFDDKLMIARFVVDQQKDRVASVIKSMIKT